MSIPAVAQIPAGGEFIYPAKPGDTLIGLSRRLLQQPRRWPEVQERNHIANPYRIKPGTPIRIPYSWLRLSPEMASVSRMAGTVTSAGQPVQQGQTLPQGSLIETGADGSVALELADGSHLTLQKSSALQLQEMQHLEGMPDAHDVRLHLGSGHVETNVKPHRDVGRFEIVTPTAVLAVRGTTFRANTLAAEQTATAETLEGTVAVSAQAATVEVPASFGTRVTKDSPPLQPVPLLPPPDLSNVPNTNPTRALQINITPVAGAKAYHAQISTDPDFATLTADVQAEQPSLTVALADGTYWLRARGIDQLGLEGRDAVKPIVQQFVPEPPRPPPPRPALTALDRHRAQFDWRAGPGEQYRVQIARDPAFKHIMTEQIVEEGKLSWRRPWPGHYYIRLQPTGGQGAGDPPGEAVAFDVPAPLWFGIAVPVVMLVALLI
jgi:hypothetical protein